MAKTISQLTPNGIHKRWASLRRDEELNKTPEGRQKLRAKMQREAAAARLLAFKRFQGTLLDGQGFFKALADLFGSKAF